LSWDAVGAIGEIIGAAAVVITLVYLAAQVGAANRSLRTSVRDSAFRQIQDWNDQLVSEPELPLNFQRGLESFDSLDEAGRARFLHMAYSFVKLYENLYLHHVDGSLPDDAWEGTMTTFMVYMGRPGLREYWEERRGFFHGDFVRFVDHLDAPTIKSGAEVSKLGLTPSSG
jgi:hypothetical protein